MADKTPPKTSAAADATVEFTSTGSTEADFTPAPALDAAADSSIDSGGRRTTRDALKEEAGKLSSQATDRARSLAGDGKAKATGALGEFARMMTDAAGSVDDRLGAQYGDYARSAAGYVSGFADTLDRKEVDDLVADARDFVRKSPMIAIGTAAAVGFVLARVIKAGIDGVADAAENAPPRN